MVATIKVFKVYKNKYKFMYTKLIYYPTTYKVYY